MRVRALWSLLVVTSAIAQGGFAVRVRAAARVAPDAVMHLAAGDDLTRVVDALLADAALADRRTWLFTRLFAGRHQQVAAIWASEPAVRRQRAEFLAHLGWYFFLHRYANGADDERADIVAVVDHLHRIRPIGGVREQLHGASLRTLQAIEGAATRLWRTEPSDELAALRRADGVAVDVALLQRLRRMHPAHFAGLVEHPVDVVRLRGMAMLRLTLCLPLPSWLGDALLADPAPVMRRLGLHDELTDANAERWLLAMAQPDFHDRPKHVALQSERLAERVAIRFLELARQRLSATPASHGDEVSCFLALLHRRRSGSAALANALTGLLEDSDPQVAMWAAELAERVAANVTGGALRAWVADLASKALAGAEPLQTRHSPGFQCQPGVPTAPGFGEPATAGARMILAVARAGELALLPGLLQRWRDARADDHRAFLLRCLAHLAPRLDGAQARELLELVRSEPIAAGSGMAKERMTALQALLASVPDDLLGWYRDRLPEPDWALQCARTFLALDFELPPARCAILLDRLEGLPPSSRMGLAELWLPCLDRLTTAWARREENRSLVARVLERAIAERPAEVLQMRGRGDLTAEQCRAALPGNACSLPILAACVGPDGELGEAAGLLAARVQHCEFGEPGSDLEALGILGATTNWTLTAAAARHALGFGTAGRRLVERWLDAALTSGEAGRVVSAAAFAVVEGIELEALHAFAGQARAGDDAVARNVADAIGLRWHGLRAREVRCPDPIEAVLWSQRTPTFDELRALVPEQDRARQCTRVLRSSSPGLAILGLQLAAELAEWSGELEHLVASSTTHDEPGVRAAAYRALRTRDRDVVAAGWLCAEIEFDPDPTVRLLR